MPELFDSPVAGFDSPLEILDGCHHRVRRNCALIRRIAEHLEDEGLDDEVIAAAGSVLRYFDLAGRDHHRDEEEDLFPALLEAATRGARPGVATLVERLRGDHRSLEAMWESIRASLEAIRKARPGASLDPSLAARFERAYEDHIAEEERLLLPLARRLLPPTPSSASAAPWPCAANSWGQTPIHLFLPSAFREPS